jgi:hypothetical protein
MKQADSPRVVISWLAIDAEIPVNFRLAHFVLVLEGDLRKYQAIKSGDWVLIINKASQITRVARVLRVRSDLAYTTLYFDKVHLLNPEFAVDDTTFTIPENSNIRQILWEDFQKGLEKDLSLKLDGIPALKDQVYIRELLQLSVMDDLLGPAGGPNELIVDMSVRDRYLVGKLAPREIADKENNLPMDAQLELEEPEELVVKAQIKKLDSPNIVGSDDIDDESEIDASSNQSLIPSSMGLTFCVDGDAKHIQIEARWGSYERLDGEDHDKVK